MKAITCRSYGVLRLEEVDEPVPGADDVLVDVRAASVNAADWHLIRGAPYIARLKFGLRRPNFGIPGSDLAGTVRAVGRNVTTFQVGDDVFGTSSMQGFGAFAERAVVRERLLVRKPPTVPFDQAAAIPLAASWSWAHRAGVGTFAVQLAAAFGAEVTAVCSTRNLELVRSLGAAHVIDYTTTDFTVGGARFDVILQAAGTHSPAACRRALVPRGALVQISGDSSNRWIGPLGRIVAAAALSPLVSQRMTSFTVQPNQRDLALLADLVERGHITPVLDRTFALGEASDAVRHVEGGHTRGKAVINLNRS